VQIIRSLAEALSWFEKELSWKVEPGELRHLTGRIGELYVAMITRGQMALATNQRGYDVTSAQNERISVKTFTTSNHMSFRKSNLSEVDRIIVLKINVEEGEASIEEIADSPAAEFVSKCQDLPGEYVFNVRKPKQPLPIEHLSVSSEARSDGYRVVQYENGTILVEVNGVTQPVAMTVLRQIALKLGVGLLNGSENPKNTRQLGAEVIAALNSAVPQLS
jgi:hypothetical protein